MVVVGGSCVVLGNEYLAHTRFHVLGEHGTLVLEHNEAQERTVE